MVQIIGQDNTAVQEVTCKSTSYRAGCGAIIRYDQRDIKSYHGTDYSGGSDGREWIVCPNCNQDIILRSW